MQKIKQKRRLLAVLLTVVLVIGSLPLTGFAAGSVMEKNGGGVQPIWNCASIIRSILMSAAMNRGIAVLTTIQMTAGRTQSFAVTS